MTYKEFLLGHPSSEVKLCGALSWPSAVTPVVYEDGGPDDIATRCVSPAPHFPKDAFRFGGTKAINGTLTGFD
jgi:hypothetical protein